MATFNFLNSERRYVAGAFIPPETVLASSDPTSVDLSLESSDNTDIFEEMPRDLEGEQILKEVFTDTSAFQKRIVDMRKNKKK